MPSLIVQKQNGSNIGTYTWAINQSEEYIIKAIEIAQKSDNKTMLLTAELNYANVLTSKNQPMKAIEILKKAKEVATQFWGNEQRAWYEHYIAIAHFKLKNFKKARTHLGEAISLTEKFDPLNLEKIASTSLNYSFCSLVIINVYCPKSYTVRNSKPSLLMEYFIDVRGS